MTFSPHFTVGRDACRQSIPRTAANAYADARADEFRQGWDYEQRLRALVPAYVPDAADIEE